MSAEKYFYLNQGGSYSIDGKNDKDDFESLKSSMQVKWFAPCLYSTQIVANNVLFHLNSCIKTMSNSLGSRIYGRWTTNHL